MSVYFTFQKTVPNECKIGSSKTLKSRTQGLQTGNPKELYVYKIVETEKYIELETFLKKKFELLNVRNEWFNLTKENVDVIIDNLDVDLIKKKVKPVVQKIFPVVSYVANELWKCKYCLRQFDDRVAYWRHMNRTKKLCMPRELAVKLYDDNENYLIEIEKLKNENAKLRVINLL